MYDTDMLIAVAQVAGVFKGNPGMACLKQHANHFAPQCCSLDGFINTHLTFSCFLFISGIGFFEFFAAQLM